MFTILYTILCLLFLWGAPCIGCIACGHHHLGMFYFFIASYYLLWTLYVIPFYMRHRSFCHKLLSILCLHILLLYLTMHAHQQAKVGIVAGSTCGVLILTAMLITLIASYHACHVRFVLIKHKSRSSALNSCANSIIYSIDSYCYWQ